MPPPSQAPLAERAPPPATTGMRALLLCQVGSLLGALPLEHVSETMRPLPCEPFQGMPAFVDGLSIIRGAPVPVVDLARLLGSDSGARRTRYVVERANLRHVALAVERVIGVRSLAAGVSCELPPLLRLAAAEFVGSVATLDAQLLVVLESGLIMPASAWTSLDQGVGAA